MMESNRAGWKDPQMNPHLVCDAATPSNMVRECRELPISVVRWLVVSRLKDALLVEFQVLELSGNNIVSIMSLRLSSFPMLKHLCLQDNKITKVRTQLSKFTNAPSVTHSY